MINRPVNNSIFKPLCVGELNELKDEIYKEQFFDYDETDARCGNCGHWI
jgi:hypothetical protein